MSKGRIQVTPLSRWIEYRSWLLATNLTDAESGRVWEHMWQFVFTGHGAWCPDWAACYCEGFGVCFRSSAAVGNFQAEQARRKAIYDKYLRARAAGEEAEKLREEIIEVDQHLKQWVETAIQAGDEKMKSYI